MIRPRWPCPTLEGVFIERELLDRLARVAIQEAPDLLLSPMIAEGAARLRPAVANDNAPLPVPDAA